MKLKLESPPEGFEAEAEWRLPKKGESYLPRQSYGETVEIAHKDHECDICIVLTPKKPKRWEPEVGEDYDTLEIDCGEICVTRIVWEGNAKDLVRKDCGMVFNPDTDQAERCAAHLQKARDEWWAMEVQLRKAVDNLRGQIAERDAKIERLQHGMKNSIKDMMSARSGMPVNSHERIYLNSAISEAEKIIYSKEVQQ